MSRNGIRFARQGQAESLFGEDAKTQLMPVTREHNLGFPLPRLSVSDRPKIL